MSNSGINSNILAAGRDVNIDIKHAAGDIVHNYFLYPHHASSEGQESIPSPSSKPSDAQTGRPTPPQHTRDDGDPKPLSVASNDTLLKAAKESNIDIINNILDQVVDINCTDNNERTALHLAAVSGCAQIVNVLLSRSGISVDAQDSEARTPFLLAALYGHISVVRVLIDRADVNINAQDSNGFSAVNHAAELGHIDVLQLLLTHPTISVNNKIKYWRNTPLIGAVWMGEKECVRVLINHPKVDLDYRNQQGVTALEVAVLQSKTEIAALISGKGASPVSPVAIVSCFFSNLLSGS